MGWRTRGRVEVDDYDGYSDDGVGDDYGASWRGIAGIAGAFAVSGPMRVPHLGIYLSIIFRIMSEPCWGTLRTTLGTSCSFTLNFIASTLCRYISNSVIVSCVLRMQLTSLALT